MAVLDVHWHRNPKVLALGLEGMAMHAWGISYSDAALTDGFVPEAALPNLRGVKTAVKRLVDAGMWTKTEGGYRVHDYLEYNRSRAKVLEVRAVNLARKKDGRHNGIPV